MTHHRIKPKHALFATIFSGLALLSIASDAQTTGTSKKGASNVESPSSVSSDSKVRDIDGVAAVVNTGFITRKEIDDRILI